MKKLFRDKPHFVMLVLYILVVVPGYIVLTAAVDEAHDAAVKAQETAEKLETAEEREENEEAEEARLACQQRNTFQMGTRQGDASIVDAFERAFLAGADSPEQIAQIRELANQARAEIFEGRSAEIEDRDCNGNQVIDSGDYLP